MWIVFLACVAYLRWQVAQRSYVPWHYECTGSAGLAGWRTKIPAGCLIHKTKILIQAEGYHNLTVADVDSDGRDENYYGSMVVDDDNGGACLQRASSW